MTARARAPRAGAALLAEQIGARSVSQRSSPCSLSQREQGLHPAPGSPRSPARPPAPLTARALAAARWRRPGGRQPARAATCRARRAAARAAAARPACDAARHLAAARRRPRARAGWARGRRRAAVPLRALGRLPGARPTPPQRCCREQHAQRAGACCACWLCCCVLRAARPRHERAARAAGPGWPRPGRRGRRGSRREPFGAGPAPGVRRAAAGRAGGADAVRGGAGHARPQRARRPAGAPPVPCRRAARHVRPPPVRALARPGRGGPAPAPGGPPRAGACPLLVCGGGGGGTSPAPSPCPSPVLGAWRVCRLRRVRVGWGRPILALTLPCARLWLGGARWGACLRIPYTLYLTRLRRGDGAARVCGGAGLG